MSEKPISRRVEDWRAGLGRSSCSLLARPFVCECHSISTMPRFQSPRSRLEVGLKDRLQYELERPLHHPIPDRRYRKDADLAPILRYFLPPSR